MGEYDIFSLGFDASLNRSTLPDADVSSSPIPQVQSIEGFAGGLSNPIEDITQPTNLASGAMSSILYSGKTSFSDTTAGYRMGIDPSTGTYKWIIGSSGSSADWNVTTANTFTITGAGLVSPILRYGKTSFTDSTNAGYYISSEGVYVGAASDTTIMKYTVATGAFDFIGTVSGRSTLTLANSINSSGNLITNIINARLDTDSKKILSDFSFGTVDYAGAVNAGGVTWNTTTGAITGGSGVLVYRGGIVGVNTGVTTFSISSTTGAATFAGTLSAPTGSIGGFTIGATDLSASSGGNTTTISSEATAFSAGPTGSPTVTITQAGVLTATGAVVNGSPISSNDVFGSGVDGDFALDGTNTYASSMSKSGANYTLIRDVFANDFTMSSTATLTTAGYRLFVKGTLTLGASNVIKWNGNNGGNGGNASGYTAGTAGSASTGLTSTSLYGSLAGLAGLRGGSHDDGAPPAGVNGTTVANSFADSFNNVGGTGGKGGNGNGGGSGSSGGTAASSGTITASSIRPYAATFGIQMFDLAAGAASAYLKYNGHAGSSTGGGQGGGSASPTAYGGSGGGGGGNGSDGGTIVISAKTIINAGTIQANGGNGGTGGNGSHVSYCGGGGGGGGGMGGAGGVVVLVYSSLTGAGTMQADAGTSGAGGSGGSAGTESGSGQTAGDPGVTPGSAASGTIIQMVV